MYLIEKQNKFIIYNERKISYSEVWQKFNNVDRVDRVRSREDAIERVKKVKGKLLSRASFLKLDTHYENNTISI